jgi:hypothetical protein
LNSTLTLKGKPRDFEAVSPGAVGFFFGNNSYLMNIEPSEKMSQFNEPIVPVRLDTFFRCPTLNNMTVNIVGSFDLDHIFRANYLDVIDTGVRILAVRRFSLLLAIFYLLFISSITYLVAYAICPFVEEEALRVLRTVTNDNIAMPFATGLALLVLFVISAPPFIFLARTALPSVLESLARFSAKLACYRGPSTKQ